MVLVNNPGSWAHVYPPLLHAEWHGWTPTDLIFPFFVFAVGLSIPVALGRKLQAGASRASLLGRATKRSLILILLGLAMRAIPAFDFEDMRLYGVLQRIGLVYFAAVALFLCVGWRGRMVVGVLILVFYWAALELIPVPGYGAGDLSPDGNLASYLDRLLMGDRLWRDTWDPEGLLSTLPAVVTALMGIAASRFLFSDANEPRLGRKMFVAGALLAVLGLVWDLVFPINKNLWTSSYVLFSGGAALVVLGVLHVLIEQPGRKSLPYLVRYWHRPLVIFGLNAIALFVASGMTAKALVRIQVEDGISLHGWLYSIFQSWAGELNGSLIFALATVTFWFGVAWTMHRYRVYLKV